MLHEFVSNHAYIGPEHYDRVRNFAFQGIEGANTFVAPRLMYGVLDLSFNLALSRGPNAKEILDHKVAEHLVELAVPEQAAQREEEIYTSLASRLFQNTRENEDMNVTRNLFNAFEQAQHAKNLARYMRAMPNAGLDLFYAGTEILFPLRDGILQDRPVEFSNTARQYLEAVYQEITYKEIFDPSDDVAAALLFGGISQRIKALRDWSNQERLEMCPTLDDRLTITTYPRAAMLLGFNDIASLVPAEHQEEATSALNTAYAKYDWPDSVDAKIATLVGDVYFDIRGVAGDTAPFAAVDAYKLLPQTVEHILGYIQDS